VAIDAKSFVRLHRRIEIRGLSFCFGIDVIKRMLALEIDVPRMMLALDLRVI
jgi:hypothetical protein